MSERDPFLALCDLASRGNWCWKMWCSTCGHMYFRFSFQELVDGKHPDSAAWLVRQENHQALRVLGPLPSLGGWPIEKQRTLAKILTQTDIAAIHRTCRFPDWLGYLGLALAYTEDAEREDRTITPAIVPHLAGLAEGDGQCTRFLAELFQDQDRHLAWRNLGEVESGLRTSRVP